MKNPFHLLMVLFLCYCSSLSAQNKVITGKVTDADNGSPLAGASVKLKGTQKGTATNSNGEFSLSAPETAVLILSNVGYVTQEIPVKGKSFINVALKTNNSNLNEVVVVGYKSVIKRDVSGAVSSINMKDLKDIPAASLLSLLAGK